MKNKKQIKFFDYPYKKSKSRPSNFMWLPLKEGGPTIYQANVFHLAPNDVVIFHWPTCILAYNLITTTFQQTFIF
jgi:hypothetical protein